MSEHTPTPWKLCNDGKCTCLTISCPAHPIARVEFGEWGDEYPAIRQVGPSLENRYEAYMERIGYGSIDPDTARANAAFIVRAVNNHDALMAALKEVTSLYCERSGMIDPESLDEIKRARAALSFSAPPVEAKTEVGG